VIPDDMVDRVRDETDTVSLIGEFVKLKRVGNSYRGPCPFHHGKNPNFAVSERGYHCFKCQESGDVFTFVQKHLGLDFVEAVKFVGTKSGIDVREVARRPEETDTRQPLWEVNATAADFFRTQLWESREGETARTYLASRGIGQNAADRFGLGYAPRDGAEMRESLRALGFDDDRQLAASLVMPKQDKPDEMRARFRGRLMIPIHDVQGHIVGFGGRILGAGEPKYLNSPESEIFAKRSLLYGFNWAKQAVRKADRLIIVEGYFDVIRLMLAGVMEAVAPMGTALTEQQAALIRRYTKNVLLLYDSDQAGLKATFSSGDRLLATGVSARVMTLPEGEDPDTYVAKEGVNGFEHVAKEAVDVFDRKIQILERSGWFGDLHRKRGALDKLIPTIRVTSDPFLRDLYISRVSEVAGITRDTIVHELETAPKPRRAPVEREAAAPEFTEERNAPLEPVRARERRVDYRVFGVPAERELVRMLLHQRQFLDNAAERVGADMFLDRVYRSIFVELITAEHDAPFDQIAAGLDEEATQVFQTLLDENGGIDRADESIEGSIKTLLARPIDARLRDLDRLIPLADASQKNDLIAEKERLAAEMRGLKGRWRGFNSKR
jgi:DNA primase